MADSNVQLKNKSGDKLFPITTTDNVYLPNGTPLMKYLNSIPLPLGVMLTSTSILTNAGLHLADGGEIMIGGVYDDFCQYVIANQDKFPIFYNDEEKTALEKWQEEFATYGQCTHYVITDTYVKLPYLTKPIGGVGSNLTDLGKINEAGLPDIEGSVGKIAHYPKSIATLNGAFYSATRNDNAFTGATSESGISTIHFKASKSNPIYGNSATVEIEYPKLLFYIVVATVTKTDIEVNIDNITTDLNNKIGKTECVRYPVAKWLSSDGSSWYTIYNDNFKEVGIKWAGSSSTGVNYLLPIPFSTKKYLTLVTTNGTSTTGSGGFSGNYPGIVIIDEQNIRIDKANNTYPISIKCEGY